MADGNITSTVKVSPKIKRNQYVKKELRDGKNRSPRVRKRKRCFEPTEKLPTPPPDPRDPEKISYSGERSAKRKSLEVNKENIQHLQNQDNPISASTSPRVSIDLGGTTMSSGSFYKTEDAFAHLNKLHSLLEQVLELREKNTKLFHRVRELERFKALQKLEVSTNHVLLRNNLEFVLPLEDVGFAESLLNAILQSASTQPSTPTHEVVRARSFRAPMTRQRSRSIGTEGSSPSIVTKRSSCHLQYSGIPLSRSAKRNSLTMSLCLPPPKVSKWTKVKAAFKWEKAGTGTNTLSNIVVDALEQDAARFLRLPENLDLVNAVTTTTLPMGSLPRTSEHSRPPSPGTLSSSSSIDDVYTAIQKRVHCSRSTTRETDEDPTRRSRSLEGEFGIPQNIHYATQHSIAGVSRRLDKGSKTPWGIVKDIIQSRRETVKRALPRSSVRSDEGYLLSSIKSSDTLHELLGLENTSKPRVQVTTSESSLTVPSPKTSSPIVTSEIVDLATRRLTPTLTITVPSSEELRSFSSPESMSPPTSYHQTLDSTSTDAEKSHSEDPDFTSLPRCTKNNRTVLCALTLGERKRSPVNSNAIATEAMGYKAQGPLRLLRQDSKWNKVKKAFLTSASSMPPSPSRTSSFFEETDGGGSYSASVEDLENNGGMSPTTQMDIQRNYQLLHDKLSVEFNRKLAEWEKMKNSPSSGDSCRSTGRSTTSASPKEKDSQNALLMGEDQLTPEFKKKLQEWKRMKRPSGRAAAGGTMSPENQIFRRRLTDWQIWRTPTKTEGKTMEHDNSGKMHLSEDFLKKMEEWKKIKSGRSDEEQSSSERRDSVELTSQSYNSDQRWKTLDEKEFQPLDKVIAIIEMEQQMIEKQREKLIDKKARFDKLSRVLDATHEKREVLVRTPSGYHKFEGISQEFTKKLYDWEKSQGIGPESSTFQLLNPAFRISVNSKKMQSSRENMPRVRKRSKSLSNALETSQCDQTPIRQQSSLSLNDVTHLENEVKLRIDSKQTIAEDEELLVLDDSEPEAVIVDIEDVIEETASPMARFQPQQTPVYCVTASETTSLAIPLGTVTASHEPSPIILVQADEEFQQVQKVHQILTHDEQDFGGKATDIHSNDNKKENSDNSMLSNEENRRRIFDSNDVKICETIIEEDITSPHIEEESNSNIRISNASSIRKTISETTNMTEIRESIKRNLTISNEESIKSNYTLERSENQDHLDKESQWLSGNFQVDAVKIIKSDKNTAGDVKEIKNFILMKDEGRIILQNRKLEAVSKDPKVDDVVITVSSDIRQKKVLKTRRLTDTQVGYKWRQSPSQQIQEMSPEPSDDLTVSAFPETRSVERIIINESTLNKIIVPTASNEQISNINPQKSSNNGSLLDKEEPNYHRRLTSKSESKNVLVKTKRIIFSPFSRRANKDKSTSGTAQKSEPEANKEIEKMSKDSKKISEVPIMSKKLVNLSSPTSQNIQRSKSSSECPSNYERRPPLPQSPILSRKDYRRSSPKETAPSIRMMIQRYNQKLQEDASSPASSGSGSPIWRSPTSERRVRTQMEKYQEEVRKAISGSQRKDLLILHQKRIEKSASTGIIQHSISKSPRVRNLRHEILKSTSADFTKNSDFSQKEANDTKINSSIDDISKTVNEDTNGIIVSNERRRSSLQNTKAEIFSNIKQYLIQEYRTLPIKGDNDDKSRKSSVDVDDQSLVHTVTVNLNENNRESFTCGKISPDLIHKLNALSNAATQRLSRHSEQTITTSSENSTPLRVRAQRIKQAKDDFFSRGPYHSHDPSRRQSSSPSIDLEGSPEFMKSASAGMINVDTHTFERLSESPTSTITSQSSSSKCQDNAKSYNSEVAGTFSKIASKFRRAKLKRTPKDKEGKMSTVSMLCRQSLLVDIQGGEMSKSCPTSPASHRDDNEHHSRFKQHRESN